MASQRFCLRWNNHQTNLLSVFDQLLHAETFTDVTLAVEGQYLKAHKMVLSACSPYFQQLFLNHPEKHPIVILKDVPFSDMKCLLDFMYRGEVSVDQERLAAFLKVAESLRIKGLTEVNDDKPAGANHTSPPPPPQLHRINNATLPMQKRKRGRPRKLSGSSNGTGNDFDDYESRDNIVQGSPELMEVKMGADGYSGNEGSDENPDRNPEDDSNNEMETTDSSLNKRLRMQDRSGKDPDNSDKNVFLDNNPSTILHQQLTEGTQPIMTMSPTKIRVNPMTQSSSIAIQEPGNDSNGSFSISNAMNLNANFNHTSQHSFGSSGKGNALSPNSVPATLNSTSTPTKSKNSYPVPNAESPITAKRGDSVNSDPTTATPSTPTTPLSSANAAGINSSATSQASSHSNRPVMRRRIRRKASSTLDDPAEQLTEMSVRGLNLFRYASISEGVYQCTECAKENIQKTFKNKYSFQRHAFLYHEGTQRKVFPCPVCGKEFSRPDKMKNHMKTTHECYVPKDMTYPLNFFVGAGGEITNNNNNNNQQVVITSTIKAEADNLTSGIKQEQDSTDLNSSISLGLPQPITTNAKGQ